MRPSMSPRHAEICRGSPPLAGISMIAQRSSGPILTNAISRPAGDQAGNMSHTPAVFLVIARAGTGAVVWVYSPAEESSSG